MGYGIQQILDRAGIDVSATDISRLADVLRAWSPWSAFGSIGLMVLHSVLPLPGEVIALANALIFGPLLGAVITWIGAMSGAIAAYSAARYLGKSREALNLDVHLMSRLQRAHMRPSTLLALRLVPVISFNLINFSAGICGVGWWPFLWTTSIGILPMILGISYFGDAMLEASVWGWLVLAAALAVSPVLAAWLMRDTIELTKHAAKK
ncbi:MAG: VTT domain-containing protein [Beijerinckiaceae bacterium]